jgi:hypothetical protein
VKWRPIKRWFRWARRRYDALTARLVAYEPKEIAELTASSVYSTDSAQLRERVAVWCGSPDLIWERVWAPTPRLAVERLILDSRSPAWLDQVKAA